MFILNFVTLIFFFVHSTALNDLNKSDGDVHLAVIFPDCSDHQKEFQQTRIDSAQWIIDRLNILEIFHNLKIGLQFYSACKKEQYFEVLFSISKQKNEKYLLGIISDGRLSADVRKFAEILEMKTKVILPNSRSLIKSSVRLLEALNWIDNVTVFSPDKKMVDELNQYTIPQKICIKNAKLYRNNASYNFETDEGPFVLFGTNQQITNFLSNNELLRDSRLVLAPTDGSVINDIGENTYIILPSYIPLTDSSEKLNLTPTPLLFEIAQPILSYTEFLRIFLKIRCNETQNKLECIKYRNIQFSDTFIHYTNEMILKILKIEPLRNNFVYDIYVTGNDSEDFFKLGYNFKQSLTKMFTYNIFDDSLSNLYNHTSENFKKYVCFDDSTKCRYYCENFRDIPHNSEINILNNTLRFKSEPWVIVFLAVSAIGALLSLIILMFLCVYICRKDILEGNPITTIFLLLTVLLMYCSVLLFSVEMNSFNEDVLCILRSLWTTLTISGAFSIILSRCILLSTVTKEIAYMSHIPGSVQSFLTLFIFGVQAALSLQIVGNCSKVFNGDSFLYLMSYNIMLLLLIISLCPMIYKSQRNYKEGKCFAISAVLITFCWCFWISCYRVLDDTWKDPLICFAMVFTASILLGVIFVSRTYLMIVSSTRNKLRNNLPKLNGRNGVLDIYRADERHVYDCVNVAAINAISVARPGLDTTHMNEDIYNYPTLPRDEEINFDMQTNSTIHSDKVTRF